jgi:hypothetical protein
MPPSAVYLPDRWQSDVVIVGGALEAAQHRGIGAECEAVALACGGGGGGVCGKREPPSRLLKDAVVRSSQDI